MFSTTSFTIDGLSVHIKTGNCTTTSIIMHATILTIFSSTAFAASPSTAAVLHAAEASWCIASGCQAAHSQYPMQWCTQQLHDLTHPNLYLYCIGLRLLQSIYRRHFVYTFEVKRSKIKHWPWETTATLRLQARSAQLSSARGAGVPEQLFTCKLGGWKPTHSGKSPTHSRHFAQMG